MIEVTDDVVHWSPSGGEIHVRWWRAAVRASFCTFGFSP